jgi:hypothetical protein
MAQGDGGDQPTGPAPAVPRVPFSAPDVFISYASSDIAVADGVCGALEHAGVRCWVAPRDVLPGEFYADAIVHGIDAAQAIVLVLSQNAISSPHVLREVERASSKRHPVIALRIDTAPLPPALEYFLNMSQWLDASGRDPSGEFPRLVEAVRRAVGSPAGTDRPATMVAPTVIPAAATISKKSVAVLPGR